MDINEVEVKEFSDAFTVEDIPLDAKYKNALESDQLTVKILNDKSKILESTAAYDAGLVQSLSKCIRESGDAANIFLVFAAEG